jgi:hypothetical protein
LLPETHQAIGYGMSHLDLLSRPEVCARLEEWLRLCGGRRRASL